MPTCLLASYLIGLAVGLTSTEAVKVLLYIVPPAIVLGGIVLPYTVCLLLTKNALEAPEEWPGHRLERLLKLPWRAATYALLPAWVGGGLLVGMPACIWFGKDLTRGLLGGVIALCFGLVVSLAWAPTVERWIHPLALKEYEKNPHLTRKSGFFWPRQSWFLPYVFSVSLLVTIVLGSATIWVQTWGVERHLVEKLIASGNTEGVKLVQNLTEMLMAEFGAPLLGIIAFCLFVPALSAWMLARRQERGATAVLTAIENLSSGRLVAPQWVSTDEIGDLATGMKAVLQQLKEIPTTLERSASRLLKACGSLGDSNQNQRESLTKQAAALQEANVTAQEIKQTSAMAAQKAETVLRVVDQAEAVSSSGSAAVEQTLVGLSSIQDFVTGIRGRISRVEVSARQIGEVTLAVKDLADQSNMLALNAAIEAVRSGEHGKGFGVVAREIRTLADQSIRATGRIKDILEDVGAAVRDAVAMGEQGAQQVERGLAAVNTSGETFRALTDIVKESSAAARQIAAAVNQQHTGFSQIFIALGELSKIMEETVNRLDSTQVATEDLVSVSNEVGEVAKQYRAD